MSAPQNSSTATHGTKADKKKIICGACHSELEPDHSGIQCVQGHDFCPECSTSIVKLFFSEPQNYIPLHCVQCHVELNPCVFERQLTPEQMEFYQNNMLLIGCAKNILEPNERLDHCPFCTNAVIRSVDDTNIFYCGHPECQKVSCLVCRQEIPQFKSDFVSDEELEKIERHFKCAHLAKDKQIFEAYIEGGHKVPCPQCGLAGMKDGACTHMTCPTCSQVWCYFCGKKVEECDKEGDGNNGIYDHNYDWENNCNRCPMFLLQIREVDGRWPEEEDLCLTMFHRNRTLRALREAFETIGQQRINELENHFRLLSTCGFSLEEIFQEDLTLIIYSGAEQNRDEKRP